MLIFYAVKLVFDYHDCSVLAFKTTYQGTMMGSLGDLPGPPTRAFSEKSSLSTFPCLCWVYCAVSTDLLKFEAAVSKQTKKCWRGGKFRKKEKQKNCKEHRDPPSERSYGTLPKSSRAYFGGSWQFENHPVHSELITGLLLGMHYNIIETDFNMFWAWKLSSNTR